MQSWSLREDTCPPPSSQAHDRPQSQSGLKADQGQALRGRHGQDLSQAREKARRMGTSRVRSASSSTQPTIPYCVTLGLALAHLLSGPCQLLNYQLIMKKRWRLHGLFPPGSLGNHAQSQERVPTLPSHTSSLPLSGLRKGHRKSSNSHSQKPRMKAGVCYP